MTNSRTEAEAITVIRGRGRVSALGLALPPSGVAPSSPFTTHPTGVPVAALPAPAEAAVTELRRHPSYRQLDRTVLLALMAARQATAQAGWGNGEMVDSRVEGAGPSHHHSTPPLHPTTPPLHQSSPLAVSIGSSRGATGRLEEFHAGFLAEGSVPVAASPLTTLGNVASWVAYDAGQHGGAALSHSSTCSSAFQALGNARAWLKAGMATRFLAGGTEAPLTDFTLAQMRAIGIYSPLAAADWPCRPGAGRPSTFVLGEGAAVFSLEHLSAAQAAAETSPLLVLAGVGFGFEAIGSKTGLSPEGQHFQQAIREALAQANLTSADIDAVVLHSPGTPAGDAAERAALRAIFGPTLPPLLSNKWLVGHTLGASAALSLDFACHVLESQQWLPAPFTTDLASIVDKPIRRILVNAAGFGGNAASVVVSQQ
ncbi:beta-ketoacyl synthase N-terminal-like domain-containing protein [Hymenobacter yonginensis]|uniref:Beta-ketoacyl synthase N-terminal-like domain-containing protein n=1 Tax=Hymenobacter yonginensis TaxID=748197 RepID=A0ABY7PRG1_9BACT|nr:beta-ketoacyl synthase N-terminal-like domain-containing protein [Hymenobacter yonginensis]WBO85418.1 beta-ketoacyl synthase N-terminal-like domain-containing protein [Hymenobacter yonginensis]